MIYQSVSQICSGPAPANVAVSLMQAAPAPREHIRACRGSDHHCSRNGHRSGMGPPLALSLPEHRRCAGALLAPHDRCFPDVLVVVPWSRPRTIEHAFGVTTWPALSHTSTPGTPTRAASKTAFISMRGSCEYSGGDAHM